MYRQPKIAKLIGGFAILMTSIVSAERPNVLLIVSEDNGPELGCYGDSMADTPNLDRLAADGVRFEHAFVPYSVCSPSRACFLTGLYPHQNGQIGLATHKFAMYRSDTPNITSILKDNGYRTGLIGKLHVNPESAFPFDFRAIRSANFQRNVSVDDYATAAARFFADAGDAAWFLSVNFPDAHLPFIRSANGQPKHPRSAEDVRPMAWIGVDTPRLREQVANYYNCLARLDYGVGLLLAELEKTGESENTIVIYIGDHGAQFPRGKGTVYEAGLRVPMIIRAPRLTSTGHVSSQLVSTLDILPTVLRAAGIQLADKLPGRELQPLLMSQPTENWREYIFGLTTGSFPRACYIQHSVRDQRFKLISSPRPGTINHDARTYLDESHPHFVVSGATADDQKTLSAAVRIAFERWRRPPRFELYDLRNDPYELRDLGDDPAFADIKTRLSNALRAFQRDTQDPFLDQTIVDAFVEEQLANWDFRYRDQRDFRWSYVDAFPLWRSTQK